jgi:hypothetical protein
MPQLLIFPLFATLDSHWSLFKSLGVCHSELGHFGVKHTYSLFVPHYHWKGMHAQV